ncbi:hypothetical protein FOL47_002468 [Perkinsus chesapeaki]|uniref:Uncharacterized protein n=1 Tax=Perkinsus chesapeaki TaxID=330153 RepID=A0A7J6MEC4_PERCH|nr:hypothetical protein FOL47_002468 [Perkinsus chesapeaki]
MAATFVASSKQLTTNERYPIESSSITSTASQPRTPDLRRPIAGAFNDTPYRSDTSSFLTPLAVENGTEFPQSLTELREILLDYRRDLRVLKNQLGAVIEENQELRHDLEKERYAYGRLSEECTAMRQEMSSLQDTLETERVSHLCRLIQWRGAVTIRRPIMLLEAARQWAAGFKEGEERGQSRTATWRLSLGPVSLRITCNLSFMGNDLSTSLAGRCSYCLGVRAKSHAMPAVFSADRKQTEEFLTASSTPVMTAIGGHVMDETGDPRCAGRETQVRSAATATVNVVASQTEETEVVSLSSEDRRGTPPFESASSGYARDAGMPGDPVESPSPIPAQQHTEVDCCPEEETPFKAPSEPRSSVTPRSRSAYRGSEATSLVMSEYSLTSSAAVYFSSERLGGLVAGESSGNLRLMGGIRIRGWIQRNKGGYFDIWKWCFAVLMVDDVAQCSRLSLWRTERDFEDRLLNNLSGSVPFDSFSFGVNGKHVVCEADWGRVMVIFDHEGNCCVKLRESQRGSSRPTWPPTSPWDLDTSASIPLVEKDKWEQLAVVKSDNLLPILANISVPEGENVVTDLNLKWDHDKYPVQLTATPHPEVQPEGAAWENVNVKLAKNPAPLPTSTGLKSTEPAKPSIDGVKVDLGKPLDYGALIRPRASPPPTSKIPQEGFVNPDLSWNEKLKTNVESYSITGAVPVESRGVEGWLPPAGDLNHLQEELPLYFHSTRSAEDAVTVKKLRAIAGGEVLEEKVSLLSERNDEGEQYVDIMNHIKAVKGLLRADLKHTSGYWGDWMNGFCEHYYMTVNCGQVAFRHTREADSIGKKLALEVKAATRMVDGMLKKMEGITKNDMRPMIEVTDMDRQRGGKGLVDQADAVLKVLELLKPAVTAIITDHDRTLQDEEQDIKKTVDRDKDMYTELFTADIRKFLAASEENGQKLLSDTRSIYVDLMKSIGALVKKVFKLQRTLKKLAERHSKYSMGVLDKVERATSTFVARTDRADRFLEKYVAGGPQRRKLMKMAITEEGDRDRNAMARKFQKTAEKTEEKSKREVKRTDSLFNRELATNARTVERQQKSGTKKINDHLRDIGQKRAEGEAATANAELKDLETSAQGIAGTERLVGMQKVRDLQRQEARLDDAEEAELTDAEKSLQNTEAALSSDITLAADRADAKLNTVSSSVKSRVGTDARQIATREGESNERQGRMKQSLTDAQKQLLAVLDASMNEFGESSKEEYRRFKEQLNLETANEEKGVKSASVVVQSTAEAVHSSEREMRALHDENDDITRQSEQALRNALKDLQLLGSGGSADIAHLKADQARDLTNSVQVVTGVIHKDAADARNETRDRLREALGGLHNDLGVILSDEQDIQKELGTVSSDAARAEARTRQLTQARASEHQKIESFLSKKYHENANEMSKFPMEAEAAGHERMNNVRRILREEVKAQAEAVTNQTNQRFDAIENQLKMLTDLLMKGRQQEEKGRRILEDVDSEIRVVERMKPRIEALKREAGNDTSEMIGSIDKQKIALDRKQMDLLQRRKNMERELRKGLVFLDDHLNKAHSALVKRASDLEVSLLMMIKHFKDLLYGDEAAFAKFEHEDSANTARQLADAEDNIANDEKKSKVRLENLLNVDKKSTMNFVTMLSSLTVQAQELGLSGDKMKEYIEEQLSNLSEASAGEIGLLEKELSNDMTGLRAADEADKNKATTEIQKNDQSFRNGAEGVYGQLGGFEGKVADEAEEVGGTLGYNNQALAKLGFLTENQVQISGLELKALIHSVSLTKDAVLHEMAANHGADLDALARIEDVVAITRSLTGSSFEELHNDIDRLRGDFRKLGRVLDLYDAGTNKTVDSLGRVVDDRLRRSQKFMDGIQPLLGEMKGEAEVFEKKEREVNKELMGERTEILKEVSDSEKEQNKERAETWTETMKHLSSKNKEFQEEVSSVRAEIENDKGETKSQDIGLLLAEASWFSTHNRSPLVNMTAEQISQLSPSKLVALSKGVWHSLTPAQLSKLSSKALHLVPVQAVTMEALTSYPPNTFKHNPAPTKKMLQDQPTLSEQKMILSQIDSDASISPESLLNEKNMLAWHLQPPRVKGYWGDWTNWYCDMFFWWDWCGTIAFMRTRALTFNIMVMKAQVKAGEAATEVLRERVKKLTLKHSLDLIDPDQEHNGLTPQAIALYEAVQAEKPTVETAFSEKYPKMHALEEDIKKEIVDSKEVMEKQFAQASTVLSRDVAILAKHMLKQTAKVDGQMKRTLGKVSKGAMRQQRQILRRCKGSLKKVERDGDRVDRKGTRLLDNAEKIIAKVNKMMETAGPREKLLLQAMLAKLRKRLEEEQKRQQREIRPYEKTEDKELSKANREIQGDLKGDIRNIDKAGRQFDRSMNRDLRKIESQKGALEREGKQDFAKENQALSDGLRADAIESDAESRAATNAEGDTERELLQYEKDMVQGKQFTEDELQLAQSKLKTTDSAVEGELKASADKLEKDYTGESELLNSDLRSEVEGEEHSSSGRRLHYGGRVGDVMNQVAIDGDEHGREIGEAERELHAEEDQLEHSVSSKGQQLEGRVKDLFGHGKGEVDHEGNAINAQSEDEATRLARIMGTLKSTEDKLMKSTNEDLANMSESEREEFMRLAENIQNSHNDSEDEMSSFDGTLHSIEGGLESSVEGEKAMSEGLAGAMAGLEGERDKANAGIKGLADEGSIGMKNQAGEFKKEETDSIRSIEERLSGVLGESKGIIRDDQKTRMNELGSMLGDLREGESGISGMYDEAKGGLSKMEGEMQEYKQDIAGEGNKLDQFLNTEQGKETQASARALDGLEQKELAQLEKTRQLLIRAAREAEKGTTKKDAQRAQELRAKIFAIEKIMDEADRRGLKNRQVLGEVEAIENDLKGRDGGVHKLGQQERQDSREEEQELGNLRRGIEQDLTKYGNEMKSASASMDAGIQSIDRGLKEKTQDMKASLQIGRDGISRIVAAFTKILASAANADLQHILNSDMSQEEKMKAILKLFMDGEARFGGELAMTEKEKHAAATNLAQTLDRIIKQAQALGLSGEELHDYVQKQLEKEAGVTAEEFERLRARLGGDITKFQEMLANEESSAIELLKELEIGDALRASKINGGLGDFGDALSKAAMYDGGQLGYNALATGKFITDARSTKGLFAHEVRALAHMALAMDDKLLEEIAAEKGVNLKRTAEVEDAVTVFSSLSKDSMAETKKELARADESIKSFAGLGKPSKEVETELTDLGKSTASSDRDLQRVMTSSQPLLQEMKTQIGEYKKDYRGAEKAEMQEEEGLQKHLSQIENQLRTARGKLWSEVQGGLSKSYQTYQKAFEEDRAEFSERGKKY